MAYTKTNWNNGMSPALDATNLNKIEQGIYDATDAIENIDLTPYAPKESPAFTGNPTAPTQSVGDNDTSIATTAFVNAEISNDVGVGNSSLVKTALNASGSAPIYACRAWVNFNGTGTVAIRASGNVTSITDRGTGLYSANFTTAMADANYACVQSSGDNNILAVTAQYASYVEIKNTHPNEMIVDTGYGNVSIYR